MLVEIEVLDLTEEEARVLLLSIDPLADLAQVQEQIHQRLMDLTPTPSADLKDFWQEAHFAINAALQENQEQKERKSFNLEAQFMVLIRCRDEKEQVELLLRFQEEGLECKAVLS